MSMLASFSQSNSFLTTRIALLTFYGAIYSEWSEKLLVLLEYLQLASQDLLIYSIHDDQASSQHTFFTKVVIYFFKLVNPSALMTFQGDDSLTYTILLIVICSMMFKYLLAAYVSYIAYRNRQGNALLLILWQWIFRIQCRILCYLITSFWTSIILLASKDIFAVNGMDKAAIIAVATILLTIEYKFSVLLELLLCYRLPTKNFLSSKSYRLVMITLCQKLVMQIIQLTFQAHFELLAWLLSIVNLLFTLIRGFQFYGKLPLYDFRALLFQGDLLSLVMSLNIAMFIQNILKEADYEGEGSNFIVIAWIIIGILIYKLSREYLLRSLSDLLISSSKGSAETLLHKISALKELKDILKLPSKKTKIYDFTYLLSIIKDINIQTVLSVSSDPSQKNEQEPNTHKNDNKIYLQYLQDLSCKFPRNSLVKLHIAKLCNKDPELYAKAMNIIIKLTQEKWSESFLTVSLLRYEVEKAVMNSHNNNEMTLDLLTYINSQICVDKLTKYIQKQIDLKITVCDNILGEKSNIGLIFNNAQLISKYKAQTQKQIDQVLKALPSSFIEPYLVCAGYFKVLGDSLEDYDKFNNLYLQKLFKYGKSFQAEKLNEENLYQENNIFLIVSGEKSNNGKIHYSSQSIENAFGGGEQISYYGTHISTLFTPNFHSFYSEAFREILETEKGVSLNQVKQVFLQHKSGHMIHAELYVKIHPYLTRGMYLDIIIRSVPSSSKEYLILKEDGTIEGATKSLANELGLKNFFTSSSALPNIRALSEELWIVNQAFNTMGRIQTGKKGIKKRSSLKVKPSEVLDLVDEKMALNLFKTFSGVKTVELSPIRRVLIQSYDDKDTLSYDCNVSIMSYGPALMKLVTLEKVNKYDGEQVYGSIDIPIDEENNFARRYTQNPGNQENEGDDYLSDSGNINSPEKAAGDSLIFVCRQETYVTTHGNLLSPSKRSETNRQFLFSSRGDDRGDDNNAPPQITTTQDSAFPRIKFKKEADLPVIHMNPLSSNQANPTSSQNKTASTTFRAAVGINFHPKSFTPICLMFYAVIVITFVSQVVLKVVSDNIMATLIVKKNLLTYSQLRTFKVMLVSTNARLGVTSIMAPDIQGGALFYNLPDTVTNVLNHTIDLNTYNNQMKLYASFLDEETQQELYLRNVKVYDFQMDDIENSPYRFVNNFEVIDETVEKVYKLTFLSNPGSQEALRLFYSIRYNMVDDFLYKSEMITDFLTETVQSEKEYLELMIMLCLIIIPLLLMGIVLLVTLIIWRQYLIEKKNMLAFIKLKPDEVTKILVELKSFKKNLQNKDYTEYQKPIEIDDIQPGKSRHEPQRDQRDQRERRLRKDEKEVNYSEIRTRYYGYFGKVTFYVMALIGILVWNFISARNSTRVIYNKQDQLNFASEISEVAGTQYMAAEDLFQSNNSVYVKHEKPLNLTIETQAQLKNIQSQAPSAFLELNGNYDPSVKAQLYNDNCPQYDFSQVRYLNFCYYIQKTYGQRANLISLMAYYYGLLQGKLQDWYNCNKSTLDNLVICVYINVNAVMPSFVLIFTEALSIGDTIRAALDKSIEHANYERDAFLIAFSVSLVAASLLIWYQILAKLKEGYNDFKKVLQLFPPKLILSSFQLKTFLLQHSNLIKK